MVDLANDIRSAMDDQQQKLRSDAKQGCVRFFIMDNDLDKAITEQKVLVRMAKESDDYPFFQILFAHLLGI